MPMLDDAARVAVREDATWRNCRDCGLPQPLPPDPGLDVCDECAVASGSVLPAPLWESR
jgi:hypothetical protein